LTNTVIKKGGVNMEISEIINLCVSNGFAVVIAVWCLKFAFGTFKDSQDKIASQMAELTSAVNNNTTVLTKLAERIDDK